MYKDNLPLVSHPLLTYRNQKRQPKTQVKVRGGIGWLSFIRFGGLGQFYLPYGTVMEEGLHAAAGAGQGRLVGVLGVILQNLCSHSRCS